MESYGRIFHRYCADFDSTQTWTTDSTPVWKVKWSQSIARKSVKKTTLPKPKTDYFVHCNLQNLGNMGKMRLLHEVQTHVRHTEYLPATPPHSWRATIGQPWYNFGNRCLPVLLKSQFYRTSIDYLPSGKFGTARFWSTFQYVHKSNVFSVVLKTFVCNKKQKNFTSFKNYCFVLKHQRIAETEYFKHSKNSNILYLDVYNIFVMILIYRGIKNQCFFS